MRKLVILMGVPLVAMGFAAIPFAQSEAGGSKASVTLVCKTTGFAPVFPCGLPELEANPSAGTYGTGNAFGKVQYDTAAANNQFRLLAHGLQPNTWYLVTMQEPYGTGGSDFSNNNAICLFGVKSGGPDAADEYCDVALVKTNTGGNVNEIIPTDSGLTGDEAPTCTSSNVPALIVGPNLGVAGSVYGPKTLVMKNVGIGGDGSAPNCTTLVTGGTAELFEMSQLPGFMN